MAADEDTFEAMRYMEYSKHGCGRLPTGKVRLPSAVVPSQRKLKLT